MEIIETLKMKYDQIGHYMYPEDSWEFESIVECADDIYSIMVDIYRHNARQCNDYPINGYLRTEFISFYVEKSIKVAGETYVNAETIECDKPKYYNEAYNRYNEFVIRVKTTLPNLRKINKVKDREKIEKLELNRLKNKYE